LKILDAETRRYSLIQARKHLVIALASLKDMMIERESAKKSGLFIWVEGIESEIGNLGDLIGALVARIARG
jgi:hypothetical protein